MANFFNLFAFPAPSGSSRPVRRVVPPRRCRIAALGLVLAVSGLPAVAAEPESAVAASDGTVELFSPAAATGIQTMRAGRKAVRFNRAIADLPPSAKARFSLPRGVSYELVYDSRQDHPSGNVTWSGYLKDYGDDYRAVITFGSEGVSGRILTPDGEFLVESDADGEWLIDTQAAGLKPMEPGDDDAVIPLPEDVRKHLPTHGGGDYFPVDSKQDNQAVVMAATTTPTTIDVMLLYTPGLASRLGSGLSARLDQLVALSNQAYRDSGVYINLRLVHKQQVNYSDTTTNLAALNALTNGSDPALAGVASLRTTKGADLVSLIRPFNYSTSGGSCGVGWIGGYNGQPMSGYANYGYSVISDGRDVNGSGYYCLDLTFAHELGHNMGSMHDRANSGGGKGAYSYSYGYGVSGTFGTVMSYINPQIGKFSNPAITCAGGIACGVSETASNSANNALSLNNTRAAVASFRSTQVHILTVAKSGTGTVTSSPAGISYGATRAASFALNSTVTLTATPTTGWQFASWSGCTTVSGATCKVSMSASKTVTATFKPKLTVTKSGSGTVTSSPAGISCGATCAAPFTLNSTVTLIATPTTGWQFAGWSGACTGTAACTVTMSAAKNVTATFKPKLTVAKSGSGTVTSSPAGISCGTTCTVPFTLNSTVTLTATPASGQRFKSWVGCTTVTGATCTVSMTVAKTVTATFGL